MTPNNAHNAEPVVGVNAMPMGVRKPVKRALTQLGITSSQ